MNSVKENWKEIEGYNGNYLISDLGRLKSKKGIVERIMKPYPNTWGYLTTKLEGKTKLIHRLVAEAFILNPNNLPEVNHKDCDKNNNTVNNLNWCDRKGNMKHALDSGKMIKKMTPELKEKLIREFNEDNSYGRINELCKKYGISRPTFYYHINS